MSAFLCSDSHISAVADCIVRYLPKNQVLHYTSGEDGEMSVAVAKKLFDANIESLIARYGDEEEYKKCVFKYRVVERKFNTPQMINMVRCLNYQSCEVDDWVSTDTYKLFEDLKVNLRACATHLNDKQFENWCKDEDLWELKDE